MLTFTDPQTGKHADMRNQPYWESPFSPLADIPELVEFYVIDCTLERSVGRYGIATAEICRSQDFSQTWVVRTHLGHILHAGDHAKGYLLCNANFNNVEWDNMRGVRPDVLLVRKSYPNARKKRKARGWKLAAMAKVEEDDGTRRDAKRDEADYEMFLRDLEEDPELRGMVNLYKGTEHKPSANSRPDREAGAARREHGRERRGARARFP
jgi:nonsense-mediated mRNA decay protein 3